MPVNGVLLLFSLYITISKVSHHRYRFVQLSVYVYIYVYHRAIYTYTCVQIQIDAYLPPFRSSKTQRQRMDDSYYHIIIVNC